MNKINTAFRIALLFLIVITCCFFTSCGENADEAKSGHLKYYTVEEKGKNRRTYLDSLLYSVIYDYNSYCENRNEKDNKIEIVEFNSEDEMTTKLSAEIMSDTGPDIISLSSNIPFEKMISQDVFADINEIINNDKSKNKLNLDGYNTAVMSSGMYNEKQYILPISYSCDFLITSKEICNQYKLVDAPELTYNNLTEVFFNYLNSSSKATFFSSLFDNKELLENLIDDNIDFNNKSMLFNTKEFKNEIESIYKIISKNSVNNGSVYKISDKSCVFEYEYGGNIYDACQSYADYISQGVTPVLVDDVTKEKNTTRAEVVMGFAVNKNSKNNDKVLKFIKYVLSDKFQESLTGANISKYSVDTDHGFGLPVNNKVFEELCENAQKFTYSDNVQGIDNEFMHLYISKIKGVNKCKLSNNYYHREIIGDIVDEYINGEIATEKFLSDLNSKTTIFLEE